jgi:hypothetical protein
MMPIMIVATCAMKILVTIWNKFTFVKESIMSFILYILAIQIMN